MQKHRVIPSDFIAKLWNDEFNSNTLRAKILTKDTVLASKQKKYRCRKRYVYLTVSPKPELKLLELKTAIERLARRLPDALKTAYAGQIGRKGFLFSPTISLEFNPSFGSYRASIAYFDPTTLEGHHD